MSAITQTVDAVYEKMEKSTLNFANLRETFMQQVNKFMKTNETKETKPEPPIECNIPDCTCKTVTICPPGCSCKQQSSSYKAMSIVINGIGILLAILATYMIISTDSKLYLVFWISYSILRRMMIKSKKHLKSD